MGSLWSFSFSPPVMGRDAVGRAFASPARALSGASGQELLRCLSQLWDAGGGGTLHYTPTLPDEWAEWDLAEEGAAGGGGVAGGEGAGGQEQSERQEQEPPPRE
jgi:hypothetical protein